jgi:nicotinamide-nucleotide amidase
MSGLAGRGRDALAVVLVGDELLLADVVDVNGVWLGRRLAEAGLRVVSTTQAPDDVAAIVTAIRRALMDAPSVIVTGGLGPTSDDRTTAAIAAMSDTATSIPNPVGSAAGIRLQQADGVVYALPGVPREMRAMAEASVLPDVLSRAGDLPVTRRRSLRLVGLTESAAAARLVPLEDRLAHDRGATIAYVPSPGEIEIRLTVRRDADQAAAEAALQTYMSMAAEALGPAVYGVDHDSLAAVVIRTLVRNRITCATAESLTGGALGAALTDIPGSSAAYRGGVVAYATDLKHRLLGVPAYHLARRGAVDKTTAIVMAEEVRMRLAADFGVATTGVAGPDEQEGKPPGMVFVAAAGPDMAPVANALLLTGDRGTVRRRAVVHALDLLRRAVLGLPMESPAAPRR